jgi:hypothetical protein
MTIYSASNPRSLVDSRRQCPDDRIDDGGLKEFFGDHSTGLLPNSTLQGKYNGFMNLYIVLQVKMPDDALK